MKTIIVLFAISIICLIGYLYLFIRSALVMLREDKLAKLDGTIKNEE